MRALALLAATLAALLPGAAAAGGPCVIYRLDPIPIDEAEAARLTPLLERGELGVIESRPDGRLKQVTVLSLVDAPPDLVYRVLADPEQWPRFVPNLVEAKIVAGARGASPLDLAWELEVPLTNLDGVLRLRLDPVRRVVAMGPIAGDVPEAAFDWRFVAAPGGRTLLIYTGFADVRRVSWLMRQLIKRSMTVEHGSVLSSAIVFTKAVRLRALQLAGRTSRRPLGRAALGRLELPAAGSPELAELARLLGRGMVAQITSDPGGHLRQATVLTRIYRGADEIYRLVSTPGRYRGMMPTCVRSDVRTDNGRVAIFELELDVPLSNLVVLQRMVRGALRVDVENLGESQARSAWGIIPEGPRQSIVAHALNADVGRLSWIAKRMIAREPFFEHGLNVSIGLLTELAVRGRAEGWR